MRKLTSSSSFASKVSRPSVLAVLVAVSSATPSFAAVATWTSDTSSNWTNPANWAGGVAPSAGDSLNFNGTGTGAVITATNDYPAGTQFGFFSQDTATTGTYANGRVAIGFGGPQQFILAGNDVGIVGDITNNSGLLQTINFNMVGRDVQGTNGRGFGMALNAGTGGLTINGNIGLNTTGGAAPNQNGFVDFLATGPGTITLNGANTHAAFLPGATSNLILNNTNDVKFFGTVNSASMTINTAGTYNGLSDVRLNGNVTINGNGLFKTTAYLATGGAGVNATWTLNDTARFQVGTDLNVADGAGSVVTMNIKNSAAVTSATFFAGRNGNATVNMSGGTIVTNGFRVGTEIPAVGVFNQTNGAITANAFVSIGAAGAGTLNMSNDATFTTNQDFNVSDVGSSNGIVRIADRAILKAGRLFVGKGNNAAGSSTTVVNGNTTEVNSKLSGIIVQTGGQYIQNGGGDYRIAGSATDGVQTNQNNVVGVWDMTGGTLAETSNFQIGTQGAGRLSVANLAVANSNGGYPSVGRFATGFGLVDVKDGGTFNQNGAGNRFIVAEDGSGVLNVRTGGILNVNNTTNATSATLSSSAAALTIGNNNSANAIGIVNLMTGGTINTRSIGSVGGASNSTLNFEGGTLRYNGTADTASFVQNLNNAIVYDSGATIDTNGYNATISQVLKTAAGTGVSSITGTGTGYKTAPIVRITGGGGVGATAIANIDASGNLTGIVMTAPGTGYTSTPTVTIYSANGGALSGPLTINTANNAGTGGLTKTGAGTLVLNGANTYGGTTTVVNGGLGGTGSLTGPVNVGTGATLAPGNLGVGTFTVASTKMSDGSTLAIEVSPSGADLLVINGDLDLSSLSDSIVVSGIPSATPITLVTYSGNRTGTFNTESLPAGYQLVYGPATGGGSVQLVPEPATFAALGGLAAMGLRRRR